MHESDIGPLIDAFPLLWVALILLVMVMAVVWFFLPFALFGTKPLLRETRDELRTLNRQLRGEPQIAASEAEPPEKQFTNYV